MAVMIEVDHSIVRGSGVAGAAMREGERTRVSPLRNFRDNSLTNCWQDLQQNTLQVGKVCVPEVVVSFELDPEIDGSLACPTWNIDHASIRCH